MLKLLPVGITFYFLQCYVCVDTTETETETETALDLLLSKENANSFL